MTRTGKYALKRLGLGNQPVASGNGVGRLRTGKQKATVVGGLRFRAEGEFQFERSSQTEFLFLHRLTKRRKSYCLWDF